MSAERNQCHFIRSKASIWVMVADQSPSYRSLCFLRECARLSQRLSGKKEKGGSSQTFYGSGWVFIGGWRQDQAIAGMLLFTCLSNCVNCPGFSFSNTVSFRCSRQGCVSKINLDWTSRDQTNQTNLTEWSVHKLCVIPECWKGAVRWGFYTGTKEKVLNFGSEASPRSLPNRAPLMPFLLTME